jgi:hypothetical protein
MLLRCDGEGRPAVGVKIAPMSLAEMELVKPAVEFEAGEGWRVPVLVDVVELLLPTLLGTFVEELWLVVVDTSVVPGMAFALVKLPYSPKG